MERLVKYLEVHSRLHWQPMEFLQHWCYMHRLACVGDNACCHVLTPLEFAGCGLWQPDKQGVAEVKA